MSSPLGGFYINARNRNTARKADMANRLKLNVYINLQHQGITLIDQIQPVLSEQNTRIESDTAIIDIIITSTANQLLNIDCQATHKHANDQATSLGQQTLSLSLEETLTTLLAGDENTRLTVQITQNESQDA